MDTYNGPECGSPHPELTERTTVHGETLPAVVCTAHWQHSGMTLVPHKGKHRAKFGRHLVRWS